MKDRYANFQVSETTHSFGSCRNSIEVHVNFKTKGDRAKFSRGVRKLLEAIETRADFNRTETA